MTVVLNFRELFRDISIKSELYFLSFSVHSVRSLSKLKFHIVSPIDEYGIPLLSVTCKSSQHGHSVQCVCYITGTIEPF